MNYKLTHKSHKTAKQSGDLLVMDRWDEVRTRKLKQKSHNMCALIYSQLYNISDLFLA